MIVRVIVSPRRRVLVPAITIHGRADGKALPRPEEELVAEERAEVVRSVGEVRNPELEAMK